MKDYSGMIATLMIIIVFIAMASAILYYAEKIDNIEEKISNLPYKYCHNETIANNTLVNSSDYNKDGQRLYPKNRGNEGYKFDRGFYWYGNILTCEEIFEFDNKILCHNEETREVCEIR